jgi:hypothetical protein
MIEIHFVIVDAPEGGFLAQGVGADIFTEADDLPALQEQVRDAVRCHLDADERPTLIRLHLNREEAIAAHRSHMAPLGPLSSKG